MYSRQRRSYRRRLLPLGCAYCGGEATTLDHIKPKARGGKSTFANMAPACWPCNQLKDRMTAKEFQELLDKRAAVS